MSYVIQLLSSLSCCGIEMIYDARKGRRERPLVICMKYAERSCVGVLFAANAMFEI
jgi:hypothetical protein